MSKSIIIVGMGAGLSTGIAEKFGNEGYQVGMISRSTDKLIQFQETLSQKRITAFYATADVADEKQLQVALKELVKKLNGLDVLQYNAVDYRMKHILEETIADLTNGFKISVGNVLVATQEVLPFLQERKGSILLTGGASANYPDPNMASISLGKAGIRNLAFQLNNVLKSKDVFVGTVTIGGWINHESETHSPKQIAEQFWKLNQERDKVEIEY
jgi:NADP-dependent 3-hydroxy acid dehydrogenase YdfG